MVNKSQADFAKTLCKELACAPEQVEKKTMWLVMFPTMSAHSGHALGNVRYLYCLPCFCNSYTFMLKILFTFVTIYSVVMLL